MASTAAGQAKLAQMVASGMGKRQALNVLTNAQKKQNAAALAKQATQIANPTYQDIRDAQGTPAYTSVIDKYNQNVATANEQAALAVPGGGWTLEGDPVYQAAMASGASQFNMARANALADKQNTETQLAGQRKSLDANAAENRRRLAGNYAARGMAGGAAGALTLAEARANAEQIAARTSIQDQLAALNQQYLASYGDASAKGYDWTGTLAGQQYKTQAAQTAIQAQLAKYGVA